VASRPDQQQPDGTDRTHHAIEALTPTRRRAPLHRPALRRNGIPKWVSGERNGWQTTSDASREERRPLAELKAGLATPGRVLWVKGQPGCRRKNENGPTNMANGEQEAIDGAPWLSRQMSVVLFGGVDVGGTCRSDWPKEQWRRRSVEPRDYRRWCRVPFERGRCWGALRSMMSTDWVAIDSTVARDGRPVNRRRVGRASTSFPGCSPLPPGTSLYHGRSYAKLSDVFGRKPLLVLESRCSCWVHHVSRGVEHARPRRFRGGQGQSGRVPSNPRR